MDDKFICFFDFFGKYMCFKIFGMRFVYKKKLQFYHVKNLKSLENYFAKVFFIPQRSYFFRRYSF